MKTDSGDMLIYNDETAKKMYIENSDIIVVAGLNATNAGTIKKQWRKVCGDALANVITGDQTVENDNTFLKDELHNRREAAKENKKTIKVEMPSEQTKKSPDDPLSNSSVTFIAVPTMIAEPIMTLTGYLYAEIRKAQLDGNLVTIDREMLERNLLDKTPKMVQKSLKNVCEDLRNSLNEYEKHIIIILGTYNKGYTVKSLYKLISNFSMVEKNNIETMIVAIDSLYSKDLITKSIDVDGESEIISLTEYGIQEYENIKNK